MQKKLYKLMNWPLIEGITYSEEANPYKILGDRTVGNNTLIQAFFPDSKQVNIIIGSGKKKTAFPMELADDMGFYAALLPGRSIGLYEFEIIYEDKTKTVKDPYYFTDYEIPAEDINKLKTGLHYSAYQILGADICKVNGVSGVHFAVWAPNAMRVSLLCEANGFDGRVYPMQYNADAAIFELFVPDMKAGDLYNFEIKFKGGNTVVKLDPYAKSVVERDGVLYSCIVDDDYSFTDSEYREKHASLRIQDSPMSICEINLSHFARSENGSFLNYKDLAAKIVSYVKEMGYTHVELMPVSEYTDEDSLGYTTLSYYAVSNRYGSLNDFKEMVDILHNNDIGVIIDWTCAYFDPSSSGLGYFDGTCLYEHLDEKKRVHPFLGTSIFNYGRPEVSNFLIANALFFIENCHVDGLCVNSLSSMLYLDYGRNNGEWISNMYGGNENLEAIEFIKHFNSILHKRNRGVITIAREDAAFPKITSNFDEDGLGFDFKFNNGFSDDYMSYLGTDPYFRSHKHNDLTFSMIYQYSENFINGFTHDYLIDEADSITNIIPGDEKDKYASLRLSYAYFMTHPGRKINYAGLDFGNNTIVTKDSVIDWSLAKKSYNKGLKSLVKDLNKLYLSSKAFYELDDTSAGFEWINCINSDKCSISYLRKGIHEKDSYLVICNFANSILELRVGTPLPGKYKEVINTDDKAYGGKNITNNKIKAVSEIESDGKPYSFEAKLGPLSAAVFKYTPFTEREKYQIEKKKEAAIAKTNAARFREIAEEALKDYEEAKAVMEEASLKMKEAKEKQEKALANENAEIERAKRALEDAK